MNCLVLNQMVTNAHNLLNEYRNSLFALFILSYILSYFQENVATFAVLNQVRKYSLCCLISHTPSYTLTENTANT
jgi:hypothetical protein